MSMQLAHRERCARRFNVHYPVGSSSEPTPPSVRNRRVGDVCRASGEGQLIEPKPAGRPRHQGLLLVPLAEAERTEQHRAVALALGEPIQAGPSVEEARRALSESQHQHRLARSAIATLEAGARDLAPQLTFAVRM